MTQMKKETQSNIKIIGFLTIVMYRLYSTFIVTEGSDAGIAHG